MPGRLTFDQMQLDALTSRAIAKGIGERLRQVMGAEPSYPDELQRLINEMREREMRAPDKSS